MARNELDRMGPLTRDEKWLMVIMFGVMAGWVTSSMHGIPNTFVALAGLSALLLARVITWDDLLSERKAWDALIWFAPLVMMADALNETGVIKFLSGKLFRGLAGWPWPLVLLALVVAYLYVHYSFARVTAHVTALYPGFLAAALAGGVPLAAGGASTGVLLESERRHHSLRDRVRSGLLRRRLCRARRLVAAGISDLAREPGDMDGSGNVVVEVDRIVVRQYLVTTPWTILKLARLQRRNRFRLSNAIWPGKPRKRFGMESNSNVGAGIRSGVSTESLLDLKEVYTLPNQAYGYFANVEINSLKLESVMGVRQTCDFSSVTGAPTPKSNCAILCSGNFCREPTGSIRTDLREA